MTIRIILSLRCGELKRQNPAREVLAVAGNPGNLNNAVGVTRSCGGLQNCQGEIYKDATISHVEADGIVPKTKTGISKVYFVELPKDVQERFR